MLGFNPLASGGSQECQGRENVGRSFARQEKARGTKKTLARSFEIKSTIQNSWEGKRHNDDDDDDDDDDDEDDDNVDYAIIKTFDDKKRWNLHGSRTLTNMISF